ncbi:DEAD/DEAH box helicase [Planktomarina temperata]|nr:DEAD/DEAH box helicase [Planktomarina temperata]
MQEYTPRYYQADAVKAATQYLKEGGSAGLAVLPTGTGKSHIIADLIQTYFNHNNAIRILMVTHVKELIEQNFDKLKMHWESPPGRPPAGINSAGLNSRAFTQPIIYAGIQSVFKFAKKFGTINLLLIDECHLLSDKSEGMYRQFIRELKTINPALRIIGLTATPFRMDMGHLCEGKTFDKVFYDISSGADFTKLISEGYLSDLKGIQPNDVLDLSKVQKTRNDFAEWSLDEHINRAEITKKIVSETMGRLEERKKGLAFCVSKSHAEDMAARFNEAGLTSTFIHSDLSADVRAERLSNFKNGKFSLIANVGVLTTGFDAPDLDFIVMARPTSSPSLHIQMLGRGMRPHPSKDNCLVLDYGGNISRLGFVNDINIPDPNEINENTPKVKKCESCDALISISSQKCKFCGTQVIAKVTREIIPLENVYVGEIIRNQTRRHRGFSIELMSFDSLSVILLASKVTGQSDGFLIYRKFANRQSQKDIIQAISEFQGTRRIEALRAKISRRWAIYGGSEISNSHSELRQLWPALLAMSGDQLQNLFIGYEKYETTVKDKNYQIAQDRVMLRNRFIGRVFDHHQPDCPLNKNKSCFFFVSPRTSKWICGSCRAVTDQQEISLRFEAMLEDEKVMSQENFFLWKVSEK